MLLPYSLQLLLPSIQPDVLGHMEQTACAFPVKKQLKNSYLKNNSV